MQHTNPAVDAYIERANDFAKPILKRLRKLFHQACPEIREEIKWNFPCFVHHGIVGNMAAFKAHVSWGFWNAKLLPDPNGILEAAGRDTNFCFKPKSLADLPPDEVILEYIRRSATLNEQGIKPSASKRKPAARIEVPKDLQSALRRNAKARATFERLSPSHQREYIEWITEAKKQATRDRRLQTTLQWLEEGRSRNWM
jgi:uncharacterized protein YdeI (YjbR/CyaY-like superfamily)